MKVLEAQAAILTNYEVQQHLVDLKKKYKSQDRRRGPPNYEQVVKSSLTWLETFPSPLSQKPLPYNDDTISQLLQRLRPFSLSKGELVMLINLRPSNVAALDVVIEDQKERFTTEQQEEILEIVAQVLGQFPPDEAELEEGADEETAAAGDVNMEET